MSSRVLLEVHDLKKYFPIRRGVFRRAMGRVPAVDGINFILHENETLGLAGESGCGKTTAIRAIMQIYRPTAGRVLFRRNGELVDITGLGRQELKQVWGDIRMVSLVFAESADDGARHHCRATVRERRCQGEGP